MTPLRRTALVAGLLYLATFVAGIPPSFLYGPVLTDPSAVLTAGNDGQIPLGRLPRPLHRHGRHRDGGGPFLGDEASARGRCHRLRDDEGDGVRDAVHRRRSACSRWCRCGSPLPARAIRAMLTAIGQTLVDVRNGAYLLGPGLMPAFNACLLGLPDVPLRARPAMDAHAGAHRRAAAVLVDPRDALWRQRRDVACGPASRPSRSSSGSCRSGCT